jgi:hypothetical protein
VFLYLRVCTFIRGKSEFESSVRLTSSNNLTSSIWLSKVEAAALLFDGIALCSLTALLFDNQDGHKSFSVVSPIRAMDSGVNGPKWGRHGFDGNACGQEAYRGAFPRKWCKNNNC